MIEWIDVGLGPQLVGTHGPLVRPLPAAFGACARVVHEAQSSTAGPLRTLVRAARRSEYAELSRAALERLFLLLTTITNPNTQTLWRPGDPRPTPAFPRAH